jgi:hypothetical protein
LDGRFVVLRCQRRQFFVSEVLSGFEYEKLKISDVAIDLGFEVLTEYADSTRGTLSTSNAISRQLNHTACYAPRR